MIAVGVALAAALGGVVRVGVWRWGWPGTLAVNVVGSFVLGVILSAGVSHDTVLVVGTGFCGSLTTFSSFALDASIGPARRRATIVGTTTFGCLAAAAVGYAIGS